MRVVVRSRARIDLQRIVSEYFDGFGRIVATPDTDYPVRFVTPKLALCEALGRAVEEITYGNFKAAATEGRAAEARLRSEVYSDVWSELRRLEESSGSP